MDVFCLELILRLHIMRNTLQYMHIIFTMSEKLREQPIIIEPGQAVQGIEFGELKQISDREMFEGSMAFLIDLKKAVGDEIALNHALSKDGKR